MPMPADHATVIGMITFIDNQLARARKEEVEILTTGAVQLDDDNRITQHSTSSMLEHVALANRARVILSTVNSVALAANLGQYQQNLLDPTEGGFFCEFTWRWSRYIESRRAESGYETTYNNLIELTRDMARVRRDRAKTHYGEKSEKRREAEARWRSLIQWCDAMLATHKAAKQKGKDFDEAKPTQKDRTGSA